MGSFGFLDVQAAYERKIKTAARYSYKNLPGFGPEDVEQELLEVLWRCTNSYKADGGAKFNTYFWQCARNKLTDLQRRAKAVMRQSEFFAPHAVDICNSSNDVEPDGFVYLCDIYRSEISAEDAAIQAADVREAVDNLSDTRWQELVGEENRWLAVQSA